MELAENITLGVALLWALLQLIGIRSEFSETGGIFPASISSLLLYFICILFVLGFHLSPFHLIWLAIVSLVLGVPLIMFPPIQALAIGFMGLLAMTTSLPDDDDDEDTEDTEDTIDVKVIEVKAKTKSSQSQKKGKGFS